MILSSLLLIFLVSVDYAQNSCNKLSENSLGISFCAPSGWIIRKNSGREYQSAYGEVKDGFTPNLNIEAGDYNGTLSDYVKAGVDYLLKNINQTPTVSVELEEQSEFSSDTESGYKIVYNVVHKNGFKLRMIQYAFKGVGNTKIVITATMATSNKDEFNKLFDQAAKTYRVEKVKEKFVIGYPNR